MSACRDLQVGGVGIFPLGLKLCKMGFVYRSGWLTQCAGAGDVDGGADGGAAENENE